MVAAWNFERERGGAGQGQSPPQKRVPNFVLSFLLRRLHAGALRMNTVFAETIRQFNLRTLLSSCQLSFMCDVLRPQAVSPTYHVTRAGGGGGTHAKKENPTL